MSKLEEAVLESRPPSRFDFRDPFLESPETFRVA